MSDVKKTSLTWKYLGSMMMEKKDGHMAASFTRVLGVVLFFICCVLWTIGSIWPGSVGTVPAAMVTTLWGLIGIKGAKDVAKAVKG